MCFSLHGDTLKDLYLVHISTCSIMPLINISKLPILYSAFLYTILVNWELMWDSIRLVTTTLVPILTNLHQINICRLNTSAWNKHWSTTLGARGSLEREHTTGGRGPIFLHNNLNYNINETSVVIRSFGQIRECY